MAIHALTKQIAADLSELFRTSEVYVSLHETEEFMNVARRRIQVTNLPDDSAIFQIFNQPMLFLRLMDVRYDDQRSGYRRIKTGYTFIQDWQKYMQLSVMTFIVGYEVKIYTLFAKQALDLINLLLFGRRSTEIVAYLNNSIGIKIPVSLLMTEIYESAYEFILAGKGIKVYRVGGRLETLTWILPVNISGAQGENWWLEYWGSQQGRELGYWDNGQFISVVYQPTKEIKLRYILGDEIVEEPLRNYEEQEIK